MSGPIYNRCLKYEDEEKIPKEFETKEESQCIRQPPSSCTVTCKLFLVQMLLFLNSIFQME